MNIPDELKRFADPNVPGTDTAEEGASGDGADAPEGEGEGEGSEA
ncbi:unnamed protein product, partial [Rotaria sp. Silwood2]